MAGVVVVVVILVGAGPVEFEIRIAGKRRHVADDDSQGEDVVVMSKDRVG